MLQFKNFKPGNDKIDTSKTNPNLAQPKRWLILVLACGLVGFGGGVVSQSAFKEVNPDSPAAQVKVVESESQLLAQIAKQTGQSVVSIESVSVAQTTDIFGSVVAQQREGAGTGFIISESGIIVTNRHVVPVGTEKVRVTLADGTRYENVEIVGRSVRSSALDIAFLKIKDLKGKQLTSVKLGDSAKTKVGEKVVAIGNALGQFHNTVTSGIISGYGRDVTASSGSGDSVEALTDLFQTDAAINQGNSGGPLVNMNGEVIAINTAVAEAQNIGFAIPINDVKGLIDTVLTKGRFEQPFIGIRYVSLTPDLAAKFELTIDRGAYIVPSDSGPSVLPNSPAAKAGLKEKDVITKINNQSIDDSHSLTALLNQYKVGETINLTVNRDGETTNIQVSLEAAHE